jgi:hypothetical protein
MNLYNTCSEIFTALVQLVFMFRVFMPVLCALRTLTF